MANAGYWQLSAYMVSENFFLITWNSNLLQTESVSVSFFFLNGERSGISLMSFPVMFALYGSRRLFGSNFNDIDLNRMSAGYL